MTVLDLAAGHGELAVGFAEANRGIEAREMVIELAGTPLRLRVAGSDLADGLMAPFRHLAAAPAADAPAAGLWCVEETGVPSPRHRWPSPRGIVASEDATLVLHAEGPSVTLLDRSTGSIVGVRASVPGLAPHERAKPFPEILAVRLLDLGGTLVHAGMVGRAGVGVLIVGPTGAGKSTASLACAAAGLDWLGDDQVALMVGADGTVRAHSIYSAARLDPAHLERHPELACGTTPVRTATGEKSLLFLAAAPAVQVVRTAVPVAIIVPGPDPTGLQPLSGARALRALAPSSLLGVIGGGAVGFERLATLVEQVPCFAAGHGGEPRRLPDLVDEVLRGLGVP